VDAAVSRFRFFERMLDCRDCLDNRARLGNAFARSLAFLLISQILNDRQPSRFFPASTAAPGAPEVKAAAFARYFATVNIDPREGAVMWNLCCRGIISASRVLAIAGTRVDEKPESDPARAAPGGLAKKPARAGRRKGFTDDTAEKTGMTTIHNRPPWRASSSSH